MINNELDHASSMENKDELAISNTDEYHHIVKFYDYLTTPKGNFSNLPEFCFTEERLLEIEAEFESKKSQMLASIRVATLEKKPTIYINELEKKLAIMRFMEFFNKEMKIYHDYRLVSLIYLLSNMSQFNTLQKRSAANQKIAKIIATLLRQDKALFKQFYQHNEHLFNAHSNNHALQELLISDEVQSSIDDDYAKVKLFVLELNRAFQEEKTLLAIVPLFQFYIGEPIKYAACIIWLIENKMSPLGIFNSGILLKFFKQHVSSLELEDNEIKHLYKLLAKSNCADDLIDLANNTTANLPGFQQYALNGSLHPNSELLMSIHDMDIDVFCMSLTATIANFNNLYQLFGHFIVYYLIKVHDAFHASHIEFLLQKVLNSSDYQPIISDLINYICKRSDPFKILKCLAEFLTTETVQMLLEKKEANIFYLTPYKPSMIPNITLNEALQIINLTIVNNEPFDCLISLNAFLTAFKNINLNIVGHTMNKIAELIIKNKLYDNQYISSICDSFGNQFPAMVVKILNKNRSQIYDPIAILPIEQFKESTYLAIEDARHDYIQQLNAVKDLGIFNLTYHLKGLNTIDKYQSRVTIVERYASHIKDAADFEHLFKLITPPLFDFSLADHISERFRTLLEIISGTKNEAILKFAISMIETTPFNCDSWSVLVIDKAIDYKNIWLLLKLFFIKADPNRHLSEQQIKPILEDLVREGLQAALVTATRTGYYQFIVWCNQFAGKYKLEKEHIQKIITTIFVLNENLPENDIKMIKLLYEKISLNTALYKEFFNKLINTLVDINKPYHIHILCSLMALMAINKNNSLIMLLEKYTLGRIFMIAAKSNNQELFATLFYFHSNSTDISQQFAEAACYATNKDVIDYLYDLPGVKDCIFSDQNKYYELAIRNKNMQFINKFYKITNPDVSMHHITNQYAHRQLLNVACKTFKRLVIQYTDRHSFFSRNEPNECLQKIQKLIDEIDQKSMPLLVLYNELKNIRNLDSFKNYGPLAWNINDIQNKIQQQFPKMNLNENFLSDQVANYSYNTLV